MSRIFVVLGFLVFLATPADAQVIYSLDFDSNPNGLPEFAGPGGQDSNPMSSIIVGATGNAVEITFDPTFAGNDPANPIAPTAFRSASVFAQLGDNNVDLLNAGTSTSLSDYEFSFDALATGFAPGMNSIFAQARFQFGPDVFVNNITIPGGVTDQLQSFSFSLASDPNLTTVPAAFFGGASAPRPTFQVQILGVQNAFDDTSSTLVLDNFQITQVNSVPEPSSIAVFLGFAGLALRRRRR